MDDPRNPGGPPPDETQHDYPDDPYGGHGDSHSASEPPAAAEPKIVEQEVIPPVDKPLASAGGSTRTPPPTAPPPDDDEDDEGMLRMSFMEHLEELRARLIRCLWGLGAAFIVAISFSKQLWDIIRQPAAAALTSLGLQPNLIAIDPTEGISIIWFKLPLVVSLFLAAPWVLYQFWAFISPGLYKREKK